MRPFALAVGLSAIGHLGVVLASPARPRAPMAMPLVFELAIAAEAVALPEPEPIDPAPIEAAPIERVEPVRPRVRATTRSLPEVAPAETPVEPNLAAPSPTFAVPGASAIDVVAPPGPPLGQAVPIVLASHSAGPSRGEAMPGPSRPEREAIARAYLVEVRGRIARQKRYPRSARRLGVEGTIRVRFAIARDGSIASLRAEGDASVLREAALEAVRAAGPFRPPPAVLGPRVSVDVPLVYVLEEE